MSFSALAWRDFLNRARGLHHLICPKCSESAIDLLFDDHPPLWLCQSCDHRFNWIPPKPDFSEYIGRAWIKGEFDCWSLVREVYRDHLAIDLPLIAVDADDLRLVIREFRTSPEHKHWRAIEQPEHLSLVFFAIDHHHATHCGIWLDSESGKFLHCARNSGVVMEDMPTLQNNGWRTPLYYRYLIA